MNYKKHTVEKEGIRSKELYKSTIHNGEIIGTETNEGIIKGVAELTEESKKIEETDGLIKIDDKWHRFYQPPNMCAGLMPSYSGLRYKVRIKVKLTVEVDEEIDVDSDDLTVIDGIGEDRNSFDTIRDLIEYNCNPLSPIYSHSPSYCITHKIPDEVKENIEERIKLHEAEREVLNKEIIKKDIE